MTDNNDEFGILNAMEKKVVIKTREVSNDN